MNQGDTVIYVQPNSEEPRNGTVEHPAIVTRDWGSGGLNLCVLFDAGPSEFMTSIPQLPTGVERTDFGAWKPRT